MKPIQIPPSLLSQYAALTKNEILLHLAIQGLATAGKMKRNILQVSRRLGKTEQRLRDAEFGLKKRGLLRIHWVGNQRWWYVYDTPVSEHTTAVPPCAAPVPPVRSSPQRQALWRKICHIIVGGR